MVRLTRMALLLASSWPALCCAQGNPAPTTPPNNQQPTTNASGDTQSSPTPAAKPKKVWTNDDVKAAGSVSVIGDPRNQKYTMTKPADAATVAKYRTTLQKLQTQLSDTNKQLAAYRDFAAGKPVSEGGEDLSHGYSRMPVSQQIGKLQDKKKQLEQQIDDLNDEARKNGVESWQLK